MGRLDARVAVITGSSSGIGRAIALTFSREGASVVCSDIRETVGEGEISTHDTIIQNGGKAIYVTCDTSKSADVEVLIKKAVEWAGRVDIMVNNAGLGLEAQDPKYSIWDFPEDWWDKTMSINAKGVFLGCKFASAQMIKQEQHPSGDRGWIINIGSVLGLVATKIAVAYAPSKHAVLGLTKVVALNCAEHRIHCNAICPGWVDTPILGVISPSVAPPEFTNRFTERQPFRGGFGKPEDIARAALFFATEDCSWVTGVGLPVDGGYTCM